MEHAQAMALNGFAMRILQTTIKNTKTARQQLRTMTDFPANLVLVFAAPSHFGAGSWINEIAPSFPDAVVVGCSTAGEVAAEGVKEGCAVVTAIHLESAQVRIASTELIDMADSRLAGQRVARQIADPGLRAAIVFGQGVDINGSALVDGMTEILGNTIPITGGLAGDGGAFKQTWTIGPNGLSDRAIVAIGLAGDGLRIGHGTYGGWAPFGPARKVTRCKDNILYELDGESALGFYKRHLGHYAQGLPVSGLMFPFAILGEDSDKVGLIRTILGINEQEGSLTLAGAVQEGSRLKLMHASTDNLVAGAASAAEAAQAMASMPTPALAILVSCVGRKMVMGTRVVEEIKAVAELFGKGVVLAGYYSYGEISPFSPGAVCNLHNQTMTITTIAEI